jgi:hypothetical protein
VDKHRNRGLPSPIDADVLERAGVSPSLIPRTLQSLQTLDLIEENGSPSDVLEGLRLAPEAEYKNRLAAWLADAYSDALQFVDPATATETDIRDAFRKYTPTGQQDRMVSLFMGLFTAAGVMPPRERTPAPRAPRAPSSRALVARTPTPTVRRKADPATVQRHYGGGGGRNSGIPNGLPPALVGLLQSLPANGQGWTKEQRDKFLTIFGPMLDFCFPISEPRPEQIDIDELIGKPENGD